MISGEVDEWEIAPHFLDLLANTSLQLFKVRVKLLHPLHPLIIRNECIQINYFI